MENLKKINEKIDTSCYYENNTSYIYDFLLWQTKYMCDEMLIIIIRSIIDYIITVKNKVKNYGQSLVGGYFSLLLCYMLISLLFFYSIYLYDKWDVFSELLLLLTIQLVIHSIILCSIVTNLYNYFSKNQLIFANIHILFVIYYFLVFQLMLCQKGEYTCIISLGLAAIMLVAIVKITKKENFNERVWGIAISLSVLSGFELVATKYISIVAFVVATTNLAISISREYFKVSTNFVKMIYPEITEFEKKKLIHIYVTYSIVFWCSIDQFVIDKLEKSIYVNVLTFTVLGFWVPNLLLILQCIFSKSMILPLGMFVYISLSNIIFLARLHGNNLRQDYLSIERVDNIFESTLAKAGESTILLLLRKSWRNFKNTAKNTGSVMVGPNGPTRWGATTGAAVGFGTTTYFGSRYVSSQQQANEIAARNAEETKRANDIAEKNIEIAEKNARIAERQAIATEESNRIALLSLEQ